MDVSTKQLVLTELRKVLMNLYPSKEGAIRIVQQAGLSSAYIDFTGAAIDIWYKVLEQAKREKFVGRILKEAQEEYPKNQALKRAAESWQDVQDLPDDHPEPEDFELESVPPSVSFIGQDRRKAIAESLIKLQKDRIVVIKDVPLMGKTAYAAELARRAVNGDEKQIFWYTLSIDDSNFQHVVQHLHKFASKNQKTGSVKKLNPEIYEIEHIFKNLQETDIVCFDNVHEIEEISRIEQIYKYSIRSSVKAKFIFVGRNFPAIMEGNAITPEKYSLPDFREWLESKDLSLFFWESQKIWSGISIISELISIGSKVLTNSELTDILNKSKQLQRAVVNSIYEKLTDAQKLILDAASILTTPVNEIWLQEDKASILTIPVDESLLKNIASDKKFQDVENSIEELVDQLLLQRLPDNKMIKPHLLIRNERISMISDQNRIDFHLFAAGYYQEKTSKNVNKLEVASEAILRCAFHYVGADCVKEAVKWLEPRVNDILAGGNVHLLVRLINYLNPSELNPELQALALLIQGIAFDHLADESKALDALKKAIEVIKNSDQLSKLKARINFEIASVLNQSAHSRKEALEFLDESRANYITAKDNLGMVDTYRLSGSILSRMGNYEKARVQIDHAKQIIKDINSIIDEKERQENIIALTDFAFVMLEISEHDRNFKLGRGLLEKCIEKFRTLNNQKSLAHALGNLGIFYEKEGKIEKALQYYQDAYETHTRNGNLKDLRIAVNNIGHALIGVKKYAQALEKYKLLHQLALESRNDHFRCLALVGSADAKLGLNDSQEALKDAIEAEQIAEDFDPNGGDFGLACRILGEVWEQLGEYETAQRYLKNAEMGQLSWGDLKRTRDALKRVKAKLKSGG